MASQLWRLTAKGVRFVARLATYVFEWGMYCYYIDRMRESKTCGEILILQFWKSRLLWRYVKVGLFLALILAIIIPVLLPVFWTLHRALKAMCGIPMLVNEVVGYA